MPNFPFGSQLAVRSHRQALTNNPTPFLSGLSATRRANEHAREGLHAVLTLGPNRQNARLSNSQARHLEEEDGTRATASKIEVSEFEGADGECRSRNCTGSRSLRRRLLRKL